MRAVGAPFTLGIGAHPLVRAFASACSPTPATPNYSQLGFRVHPPNPLKGGFLALCFLSQFQKLSDQITTEVGLVSGCGSSRPVRPLDEKQVSSPPACQGDSTAGQGRAGQGRAGQGRDLQPGAPDVLGVPPKKAQTTPTVVAAERSFAGRRHSVLVYREALPGRPAGAKWSAALSAV